MPIHDIKTLNGQCYCIVFLASEKVLHATGSTNNDMLPSYPTIIALIIKHHEKKIRFCFYNPTKIVVKLISHDISLRKPLPWQPLLETCTL